MIYQVLWSSTDVDRTQWCMSRDGGITRVIIETEPDAPQPSDIMCARLQKEQNPQPAREAAKTATDFADIAARNAANKERERKERLSNNKKTLASYRIKPPSKD